MMTNDKQSIPKKQGDYDPEKTGTIYRASGNLFIAVECHKTLPKGFVDNSKRSNVTEFSVGSATRMRRYLRECMANYRQMVTLTYPYEYPADGRIVKEHLRRFLQELRREYERTHNHTEFTDHSSFWFLEFQERGAPHFHIFTTWAPEAKTSNNWVAATWYRIVNSEDVRHLQAGTRTEFLRSGRAGTISYASKYAIKQAQKTVPDGYENVGRFWGVSGRRGVMSAATFVSVADMEKTDVKQSLTRLIHTINDALFHGKLELIISAEGVRVFSSNSEGVMKALRQRIANLTAYTMKWDSMFSDAELTGVWTDDN